jgi:hypothetical protein
MMLRIDTMHQHVRDKIIESIDIFVVDNDSILEANNITHRLQLYIDLVSDLMFNFHMVQCLNLLARVPTRNASNYVYIYSHRPTSRLRSTLRDQLKLLPQAIGHFAELGRNKYCEFDALQINE